MSESSTGDRTIVRPRDQYEPSQASAILFTILFTASFGLHLGQLARYKTWYFTSFVAGVFFESLGFLCRSINAFQSKPRAHMPYVLQSTLILLAPALLAPPVYILLGQIIQLTDGDSICIVQRRRLTASFLIGDFAAFLCQTIGSILQATVQDTEIDIATADRRRLGQYLVIGGLTLQLASFALFLVTNILFRVAIWKMPTSASFRDNIGWRRHLFALNVAASFLIIRTVYCMVASAQGKRSVLSENERYFYTMDALLIWCICAAYNWLHPKVVKGWLAEDARSKLAEKGGKLRDRASGRSETPAITP